MEFKIDISKIRTNDLNALDADIQKIMETPSQSKIVNALWATLQKRVKDELLLRWEDMKGMICQN